MAMCIDSLQFGLMSKRLAKGLKKSGIFTYDDLKNKTEADIVSIPKIGRTSLRQLRNILDEKGFSLKYERQPIPQKYAIALNMREEGKKFREIADFLHVSVERARHFYYKARAKRESAAWANR